MHFAGGICRIVDDDGRHRLEDFGTRMHQPVTVVATLERERIELIELHCILARRECLDDLGTFEEAYLAGRDETDLSLEAARRGWSVWLEPSVVVGYPSPKRLRPSDYPYYLPRWSDAWWDRSLRAFQQKWGLEADERDEVFRRGHRQRRIGKCPGRHPGWQGFRDLLAWRVRRVLDHVITPVTAVITDRRRRRAAPARVVHTASWDDA